MVLSCIKQDLVVSESQKLEIFKEHRCSWSSGLHFHFKHCTNFEKDAVDDLEELEESVSRATSL